MLGAGDLVGDNVEPTAGDGGMVGGFIQVVTQTGHLTLMRGKF